MTSIKKTIDIHAPVDRVFSYLADPTHFPAIWPSMVEVSHVKTLPNGGAAFDWVYKMAGIRFTGHTDTVEFDKNKRMVAHNEKGIPSTFRWNCEGKDGEAHVTLEIEYTAPIQVLDKLLKPVVEKINEREAETLLNNLKTTMELGKQN